MTFCNLGFSSIRNILLYRVNLINNHVRCYSNRYGKLFAERLKDKCLIELKGSDSPTLLQGLITNDINHLGTDSKAIYTMFLNNRGRVMFDSIIFKGRDQDSYFLECDSSTVHILEKHVKKFKLRKKVSIKVHESDYSLYCVYSLREVIETLPEELVNEIEKDIKLESFFSDDVSDVRLNSENFDDYISFRDPRLSVLGFRVIVPKESSLEDPNFNDTGGIELHKLCRYWLGVTEGIDEIPYEQCLPLESNCDYLHGVSFHKGCYVGQELTARSHHTGVIRKRLMPVLLDKESSATLPVDIKDGESDSAKKVGKLRGYSGKYGVALLRINECLKLPKLYIGSHTARCFKPGWWPLETPKIIKQEVS